MSLDETTTPDDVNDLFEVFSASTTIEDVINNGLIDNKGISASKFTRSTPYLQHQVFNSYHSETRIVRYMKSLENKDISLVHSMIPLVNNIF